MPTESRGAPAVQQALLDLARRLGLQTSYVDATGMRRYAGPDALLALASGLTGEAISDPGAALRRLAAKGPPLIEPVNVAWLGRPASTIVRLPAGTAATLECQLEAEDGSVRGWSVEADSLAPVAGGRKIPLPELSAGYHTLHVKAGGKRGSGLVIAAPWRAYQDPAREREWGVFVPLYALHSRRSGGAGDFTDLRDLSRWARGLGAADVATLPLLASFLGPGTVEPSPYAPASRLMWNEFYVDPQRLAGARTAAGPPGFNEDIAALREALLVDFEGQAAVRRTFLREAFSRLSPKQRDDVARFLARRTEVVEYARFRARTERHGRWQEWPAPEPDFDPAAEQYHAYAQWAAGSQLAELAADPSGAGLYMDLPLGVHASGYDTWRWPQCFAQGVSVGAPPDPLATGGQNWGFPPLHPQAVRENHYQYVIEFVRHHLKHANRLRIDHVMGLHHLFLIPKGFDSRDGVYLRYRDEELYAILSLESHRHQAEIVGENLGTVPRYVNQAMRSHGISGMYVLPFEIETGERPLLRAPAQSAVASLNTHDLPMFAAWWSAEDVALRESLGQAGAERAEHEREERRLTREAVLASLTARGLLAAGESDPSAVFRALLGFLAMSPARLVLVNLEDLWGETQPQNVPGTVGDYPNWRRRARLGLEDIIALPEIEARLRALASARTDASQQDS